MSVRPIDIKTNIMGNDEASRLREQQKAQEAGLAENLAQNKRVNEAKTENVHNTEKTENKVLRKEDEDSEKKRDQHSAAAPHSEEKNAQKAQREHGHTHPKLSDGMRGLKIDCKV